MADDSATWYQNVYSREFAAEQVCNGNLKRILLSRGIGEHFTKLLADIQSKHVPKGIDSPSAARLRELATKVGYEYCDLGHHQRLDPDQDRIYVASMATLRNMRPIKLVLTQCGRLWCDNTHWGLAAMVRWGKNVKIRKIPFYLIDLRNPDPVIVGRPLGLMGRGLALAVSNAESIQRRLDRGWRPIDLNFTMRDLFVLGGYGRARAFVRSLVRGK